MPPLLTPSDLSIPYPTERLKARGRFATTEPHGRRSTTNYSEVEYNLVHQALRYLPAGITFSTFVRQVCAAAACAVIEIHEENNPVVKDYYEQQLNIPKPNRSASE